MVLFHGSHNVRRSYTRARARYIVLCFVAAMVFVLGLSLTGVFSYTRGQAQAATSSNLNFQGRLLASGGNLVADGTYNIEFNLYTVSSGGSTQWTEDYLNTGTPVTIKNGFFSVVGWSAYN